MARKTKWEKVVSMIGRRAEIKALKAAYESSYSEFVTIYGRRRIGKTFLVNEVFGYKFAFHCAGLKNEGMARQLENFRFSLRLSGHDGCPRLKSWLEAFFELERHLESLPEGRKVVFIDEMPGMDTHKSGFLAALEGFWNGWATSRKDILLIACGSATSWIVRKINRNRGGLHNRVGVRIKLHPFTLAECEEYANERRLGYDRMNLAECYMALGGVAYYWNQLEKGKSPAQNFDMLFFGPGDGLRLEFNELYSSLFKNPEPYMRIIRALDKRRSGLTRDELISEIGLKSGGGKFTEMLEDLEECGFVGAFRPEVGVNGTVFRLVDNFSLFYFQFVEGCKSRDGDYWTSSVSSEVKNVWRGLAYERLCLSHIPQIKAALGISGVHTDVYSMRTEASGASRGAQIDLLIDRKDGIVNLCEMKYSHGEYALTKEEHDKLLNRMEAFSRSAGRGKSVHLTMVTTCGLAHNMYWNDVQSEVTLDDLFR